MGAMKETDDHEREIMSSLAFMFAMNGFSNGGSIADGALFWARDESQSLTVTRKTHGLLFRRRTYTATINGEKTELFPDLAPLANMVVERVIDKEHAPVARKMT